MIGIGKNEEGMKIGRKGSLRMQEGCQLEEQRAKKRKQDGLWKIATKNVHYRRVKERIVLGAEKGRKIATNKNSDKGNQGNDKERKWLFRMFSIYKNLKTKSCWV